MACVPRIQWAYTQSVRTSLVSANPAVGAGVTLVATSVLVAALAPFRTDIGLLNVGFLFLLLTLIAASVWGRPVGILAALLSNLALNFFFLEPLHTFTVQEPRNVVALAIFLAVSTIGSALLATASASAQEAKRRQAETEVALALSQALALETQPENALQTLCVVVTSGLQNPGTAVLVREGDEWQPVANAGVETARRQPDRAECLLADRAAAGRRTVAVGRTGIETSRRRRIVIPAGRETAYESAGAVAFVPLVLGDEVRGVLRLDGPIGESPFRDEPRRFLEAVASEAAITLQRLDLAADAARSEALAQADQMKAALLASISHDLNTPLAGIKAAISSLLDPSISWSADDVAAFHRSISLQTDRLMRLIHDVLDLNRIQAGELTPEHASLAVRDLFERAVGTTREEAADRHVSIEADPTLHVVGDEPLLTQALVNLLENAFRYSREGGAVHLSARRSGASVAVEVVDEGPGIPAEDLPHVFDRFFRSRPVGRSVRGSGLGLTIVKSFVELCDGSVSVDSSPLGTTFRIRLPADESRVSA